ncbi:MAG: hypothetical protein L0227_10255 [Chloroflexi bacterium]|nr:hypothetical protein [Chloroflexota bacterium]
MIVVELSSGLYEAQPRNRAVWLVEVDAVASLPQGIRPGGRVTVNLHWLIEVDQCTAGAAVVGQG